MTTSLEKYSKSQLALLTPDKLTKAVDGFVRLRFSELDKASDALAEASKARKDYSGSNPKEAHILQAAVVAAQKAVAEAIVKINSYVEEQQALFKARGVSPDMAYTWAIVPVGETTPNGVERCRMVKRRLTFEVTDTSDDEDRSVRATVRVPSEINGIAREINRGKYNDAGILIEEAVCGIDKSEIFGID